MKNRIIAIDGPSGTGKSTTARLLGERMNIPYIDSGKMYRGITYVLLKNNVKPNNTKRIIEIASSSEFEYITDGVYLNGKDITKNIRTLEVLSKVSSVSKIKELRGILAKKLRKLGEENSLIMDGKDIGTVVFPFADFKFFLICDLNTRVARRQQELIDMGLKISDSKIMKELKKRDEMDMTRKASPLKKAKDAIEVDTTHMIIEEQVDFLYRNIFSNSN